jgi:hypothetical protein
MEWVATRFGVAALVTVIIGVAVYPLAYMAYEEWFVKPYFLKYPAWQRPFICFVPPFSSTIYGYVTLLTWAGLGISWLGAAATRSAKTKRTTIPPKIANDFPVKQTADLMDVKVLGGLYGFNGLFCLACVAWLLWRWTLLFMDRFAWLPWVCLAFVLAAYGVLRGRRWARPLGLLLSGGAVAFMLLSSPSTGGVVRYVLEHQEFPSLLYLLGPFSLSLLVTNLVCLYYLTRPQVKQHLSSTRAHSTDEA